MTKGWLRMIIHIVIGFLIPWLIGIGHLYKKDKMLIPLIGTFYSVIAFMLNETSYYLGFWKAAHPKQELLFALPFNLGFYPIIASYLIFFVKKTKHPYVIIFLQTIITTLFESIYLYFEKVTYTNGWNLILTFISYLLSYIMVYQYYLYLKRHKRNN